MTVHRMMLSACAARARLTLQRVLRFCFGAYACGSASPQVRWSMVVVEATLTLFLWQSRCLHRWAWLCNIFSRPMLVVPSIWNTKCMSDLWCNDQRKQKELFTCSSWVIRDPFIKRVLLANGLSPTSSEWRGSTARGLFEQASLCNCIKLHSNEISYIFEGLATFLWN